ncbi:MAG: aromatic acid exporter family protein [Eubacteriales bacterium]|nr:aromatic acid exporter family protein [Eubacteriales bacterium]
MSQSSPHKSIRPRPGKSGQSCAQKVRRVLLANTPGMRIIKTGLAVAICILIEYFRQAGNPSATAIVALFCLQHNLKSTWESSVNRVVGTIVAGLLGYGFLLLAFQVFGLAQNSFAYVLLFLLGLVIIMQTLVMIRMPGGAGIAAMTFIIIGFSYRSNQEMSSIVYTINTVIDTFIGIFAALFVDWLPPLNKISKKLYLAKAPLLADQGQDSDFEIENFDHDSQLRNIFKHAKSGQGKKRVDKGEKD